MIFCPPRHGKSEQVTIRYPIWRMEREPGLRVIVGAYNQALAEKFSRKARKIASSRMALSEERAAAGDWETETGGNYRAVGVGSGITGMGGNLIVIDDPVKGREQASSFAYRERVWEWYTDDLYTRLEPGGAIILIQTRWHEDDLAGRILIGGDAAKWTVISLPANAEENDPLGRKPGQALWPERYNEEALARAKNVLGTRSYQAQFQQSPKMDEGNLLKREWFPIIEGPGKEYESLVRYWDKAGTADGGNYTAGVLMGRSDGNYDVLDVARGQWSTFEREDRIKATAEQDQNFWGRVEVWIEQEPGSGGKDSALATIRNLSGHIVRAERVTGEKTVRVEPFAAQAEAGNVRIVRGAWNWAYLDELAAFDSGKYDDQVDASGGAFNKLSSAGRLDYIPSILDMALVKPETRREAAASVHNGSELHRHWARRNFCQECFEEQQE